MKQKQIIQVCAGFIMACVLIFSLISIIILNKKINQLNKDNYMISREYVNLSKTFLEQSNEYKKLLKKQEECNFLLSTMATELDRYIEQIKK